VCVVIHHSVSSSWRALSRASALGFVLSLLSGCGSTDKLSPSSDIPAVTTAPGDSAGLADTASVPTDSALVPTDSTVNLAALTGTQAGIVFGTNQMTTSLLSSVHTGTLVGGQIDPSNALTWLSGTRAKGGRIVIKMCKGADSYVKNADGTFSFTKWKALVDRFKTVNLGPYITDGTILGHFLIDEPHRAARWGGKIIPQSTIEAMAKYSKQIWPGMTTFVRVVPSWLASAPVTYTYLDAAWLQYEAWRGDVGTVLTSEVAAAKLKRLGLVVGLNVIDGGNGSSGIRGWTSGKYSMSASEIKTYGSVLLNQGYSCGFYNWTYDATYYGRSDIKSAFGDLSTKAKNHLKTSCSQ
jgi:hypothetical protein